MFNIEILPEFRVGIGKIKKENAKYLIKILSLML